MVSAKLDQPEGLRCCDWLFSCQSPAPSPSTFTTNHRASLQTPPGPAKAMHKRQMNLQWRARLAGNFTKWIDEDATKSKVFCEACITDKNIKALLPSTTHAESKATSRLNFHATGAPFLNPYSIKSCWFWFLHKVYLGCRESGIPFLRAPNSSNLNLCLCYTE